MSTSAYGHSEADLQHNAPLAPLGQVLSGSRAPGWWGMVWLCTTEGMLFASFLAAYFFLRGSVASFGAEGGRYVPLMRPLIMTLLLLGSSVTAWWGERGIRAGNVGRLKLGLALTFVLGVGFLLLQASEYGHRNVSWSTSAYDSLFITITGFHGVHVGVGLLMNLFVQVRAWLGHFDGERYEAVSNSVLYWHFVDGVWLTLLACLYLSPRLW